MESFYLIVLSIATIILIISLATIGMLMDQGNKAGPFPPISLKCPDGWTETSATDATNGDTYTCTVPLRLSKDLVASEGITVTNTAGTNNKLSYNDKTTTMCQKYKFATDNILTWDGVSNYNSC